MSSDSGNKLESPKLPNDFKNGKLTDMAPKIGGSSFGSSPNSHERGQDGTK